MTDVKISDLTTGSAPDFTEWMEVEQGGNSRKLALSTLAVKNNLGASSNPLATSDSAAGYAVGSTWFRSDTGEMWRCRSATASAAKWVKYDTSDFPGYIAGHWYQTLSAQLSAGTAVVTSTARLLPISIKERVTLSDLGARITTGASGGKAQLAIYASDPITKMPTGSALAATGDISTTTAGVVNGGGITGGNVTFEPGFYWAAVSVDATAGATVIFQTLPTSQPVVSALIGSATQTDISSASGSSSLAFTAPMTYGTWPDLTSATFTAITSATHAALHVKVASVP